MSIVDRTVDPVCYRIILGVVVQYDGRVPPTHLPVLEGFLNYHGVLPAPDALEAAIAAAVAEYHDGARRAFVCRGHFCAAYLPPESDENRRTLSEYLEGPVSWTDCQGRCGQTTVAVRDGRDLDWVDLPHRHEFD
ncbi:MAG: hypothetical protein H6684_13555 [Deltaproteobacteria bacterium]|nr:hypothetical protein [Deltaproteobacteria bacterium]MCB9479954.1 hypothetical protein [Deltaproteobacteria bacterium]MCB9489753.1 hypothetical protein [Deltaproteobacteria bacterium]